MWRKLIEETLILLKIHTTTRHNICISYWAIILGSCHGKMQQIDRNWQRSKNLYGLDFIAMWACRPIDWYDMTTGHDLIIFYHLFGLMLTSHCTVRVADVLNYIYENNKIPPSLFRQYPTPPPHPPQTGYTIFEIRIQKLFYSAISTQ